MEAEALSQLERRVRELEAFGDRGSASLREHRAAEYLAQAMREIGLNPVSDTFRGARSLAARLLIHVLVAAVGAAMIAWTPVATFVLGTIALVSFLGEQTTRWVWLSWPVVQFTSHNLWARVPATRPARRRVVLSAHYDTQHSGWVWTINRFLMPMGFRSPPLLKPPMLSVVLLMLAQMALGATALVIGHPAWLSLLTALLIIAYGVLAVLLLQWAFAQSVPGAADNASGVAAVLELADAWRRSPPADDVELIVLLPGCEESGMLGAAAWADAHADELKSPPTVFLNIDGIGFGAPRFLGTEIPAAGLPIHAAPAVIEICAQVASQLQLTDAGPHALPGPTDGLAFLARGIEGITIVGFREGGILPHYHTFNDTAANMDFAAARLGVEFARAVLWRLAAAEK